MGQSKTILHLKHALRIKTLLNHKNQYKLVKTPLKVILLPNYEVVSASVCVGVGVSALATHIAKLPKPKLKLKTKTKTKTKIQTKNKPKLKSNIISNGDLLINLIMVTG